VLRSHQVDCALHGRDALELHVKGQLGRFKRGIDPVEPLGFREWTGATAPSPSTRRT